MLRDDPWVSQETLEEIAEALEPPADWRDPATGLPAGWGDEDADWSEFEASMRG